jgi:hypothetical protein
MRANVGNGKNVRVIQRRHGPRFSLKSPQALCIPGQGLGQDLDRHLTPQPRITRAIHFAHPARAQGRLNIVRTDLGARGEGHARAPL